jgi:DegV family protein with EDD domain
MTGRVAVVTDSTADLPADLVARFGLTVVPTYVTVGDRTGREGIDITAADVLAALGNRPVTTSRATPHAFAEVYRDAFAAGATAIVSLHLSAALSGTFEAAGLAAASVGGPITVVDSRTISLGLGFAALAASAAAAAGSPADVVRQAALDSVQRTTLLFLVDSLEQLRRGGRIGAAATLIGTTLAVRPILRVADGQIVVAERVRTAQRALARLEEMVVKAAGSDGCDLAVQHLAAADRADALRQRLLARIPLPGRVLTPEVGATVGAHVGPGLLGVAVVRHR